MDKLERLISEKHGEIEGIGDDIKKLRDARSRLLIELDALTQASALRPALPHEAKRPPKTSSRGTDRRGGRQKGDISHNWRRILKTIWRGHKRVSYGEIQIVARNHGIDTQLPSIRERVRNMISNGLITGSSEKGFLVSRTAVERFNFTEDAEETKAPTENSDGASDTGEVAASPNERRGLLF